MLEPTAGPTARFPAGRVRPTLTLVLSGGTSPDSPCSSAPGPSGDELLERLRGRALPAGTAMGASVGYLPAP